MVPATSWSWSAAKWPARFFSSGTPIAAVPSTSRGSESRDLNMPDSSSDYTTKKGRVLTDAELDALAAEADLGYDIDQMTRRPGRPMLGSAPAIAVPVRLHTDLQAAVQAQAVAEQTSVSD